MSKFFSLEISFRGNFRFRENVRINFHLRENARIYFRFCKNFRYFPNFSEVFFVKNGKIFVTFLRKRKFSFQP
jgi:hypothetical protein